MFNFFQEKYKKYSIIFYLIFLAILIRIGFYIYVIVASVGKVHFTQYFAIAITLLMYFSIGKYILDYFKFGKDVSLEGILIRFSASLAASIITTQGQNKAVLIMIVGLIILVPYLAGSLKNKKVARRNIILSCIIFALTIAIAITIIVDPTQSDIYGLGRPAFILHTLNIVMEWFMIIVLGVIRGIVMKQEVTNNIKKNNKEIKKK